MFERYTERARRVLFFARYEASQLGSISIETEHMLLGLIREGKGMTSRIFQRSGIALEEIRTEIATRSAFREKVPVSAEIPFSAATKRALHFAAEEADRLLHNYIGTEHLLLGLLREERSLAAEILMARGLRLHTVREAIVDLLSRGEQPEPPGGPMVPGNTHRPVQPRFVPSPTVHILYSDLQPPQTPYVNHAGRTWTAYGFTLEEIIVQAWSGNRWHVDLAPELADQMRYDFWLVLPREESTPTFHRLLQESVERQFGVAVTRESRPRDLYVLTAMAGGGPLLKHYPDPEPGTGFAAVSFAVATGRRPQQPMFPLDTFSVSSIPFAFIVNWLEDILGGQVIDDTGLTGIYGFDLNTRVENPDAFVQVLREKAGLIVTRERREVPTLVVRRR